MDGVSFIQKPHAATDQIRFMTAGSVDDGKSTLIGRLLLDAGALMKDQRDALAEDGEDLALLTDGLEAERAQGITIDVAYRYFATPNASFIIADAPGHEQYTRNMVTAASNSDVAVIVIDATRVEGGALQPQTRRHAVIATLMGLDIIVAVNKMDLLEWSQQRFSEVETAFAELATSLRISKVTCIPISARKGDNVVRRGGAPWWTGPTLIEEISHARRAKSGANSPLRLPVQAVLRTGATRHYAGRIESGAINVADIVRVGANATAATVSEIVVAGRPVARAEAGASVAIKFVEERDITRGDMIADTSARFVRGVVADICWLDESAWKKGRRYVLRQGALETQALITEINFVHDITHQSAGVAAATLALNDIANVLVAVRDPIVGDLYADLPGTGSFALFDAQTNQTCAAGMIREVAL